MTVVVLLGASPALAQEGEAIGDALDSGDTAWILASTALVLFMTIPGLALFYGGLVRVKNVLSVLMQCLALTAAITIVWTVCGYSLAFDATGMSAGTTNLHSFIGSFQKVFMSGVDGGVVSGSIPEILFFVFQMTFAIITPALIVGAFAERMKFSAMLIFSVVWLLVVYVPICHMTWGGRRVVFRRHGRLRFRGRHRRPHHGGRRGAGGVHRDRSAPRLRNESYASAQLELYRRLGVKTGSYGTGLLGFGTTLLDPIMPVRFLSDPAFRILSVRDRLRGPGRLPQPRGGAMSRIITVALGLGLGIAVGCSQETREEAQREAETGARGLEDAAQKGAVATTAKAAEKAAEAAAAELKAQGAEGSAKAAAQDLEERVKRSAEIMKETYDDSREKGEGRVEAAGDGYEAVLKEPDEQAEDAK